MLIETRMGKSGNPKSKLERFTTHDKWATENEVSDLIAAFVIGIQPDVVVETGTYLGYTAEKIGRNLQKNGFGHLHTFEIDPERVQEARRRVVGLPVTVYDHPLQQWDHLRSAKCSIDMAFIDSEFNTRQIEFEKLWPRLHPGSIVIIHDTHMRPFLLDVLAMKTAVVRYIELPTPRGIAICEVM